jgi:hypothetical protein
MGLYFRNSAGTTSVWLAYAQYNPGCGAGPAAWSKKGWYQIPPGGTALVWSGWAGGNKFFYFAHDSVGNQWAGPFFTFVPWNAFDWCWNIASTSGRTVGFRKIDTIPSQYSDYTINLTL